MKAMLALEVIGDGHLDADREFSEAWEAE